MAQPPPSPRHLVPADSYASEATVVHADETGVLASHASQPIQTTTEGLTTPSQEIGPPSTRSIPEPVQPHSPSRPLLDRTPSDSHVQFATAPETEKSQGWSDHRRSNDGANVSDQDVKQWLPMPLQTWFWVSIMLFMVLGGIVLIVVHKATNHRNGWPTADAFSNTSNVLHYVYTIPPVAIAMFLVTMLVWTDVEIKKLQPYVDLAHGNSPPDRSLLLDYSRTSNFFVWMHALRNKHFLVALATLMGLLALTFQPLAAALLTTKDTWWHAPERTVKSQFALGLNWNPQFMDLTSFLTASGYASASVLYHLDDPPFVSKPWTVGAFELPSYKGFNGTVKANTTAVKSEPNCRPSDNLNMTKSPTGVGWVITASANGCSMTWSVDTNATSLFGNTDHCRKSARILICFS
jgi:hypothetical protein